MISFLWRGFRLLKAISFYRILKLLPGRRWVVFQYTLCLFFPWHLVYYARLSETDRVLRFCHDTGPFMIKAGQLLSTRVDLIGPKWSAILQKLQDQVPAIPTQVLSSTWQHLPPEIVDTISKNPIACASLAQVHTALLADRTQVVLKTLKPFTRTHLECDAYALRMLVKACSFFSSALRQIRLTALIEELLYHVQQETDFLQEAANLQYMHKFSAALRPMRLPKIIWEHTTADLLVTEHLKGIPLHDTQALVTAGFSLSTLAQILVQLSLDQILMARYFHADLHPGNILILGTPNHFELGLLDFGMMGSLKPSDHYYIAYNLKAFLERDYMKVAQLHHAAGWVDPKISAHYLESELRKIGEMMRARSAHQRSIAHMLSDLVTLTHRCRIQIQPQLLMLQKTFLTLEGTCRFLDPTFDIQKQVTQRLQSWHQAQQRCPQRLRLMIDYALDKLERTLTTE